MTKKLILIIEDESSLAKDLSMKLEEKEFETLISYDGEDGLRTALEKKPDLILLDLLMPTMDGLTFLKELRKDTWGAKAPVIVLTNFGADMSRVAEVLDSNVTDYLIKTDLSLGQIVKKIKDKLE